GDLGLRALHAPGHTEGSTLYLVDLTSGPAALTGDVLFAGTIGRTDLPGGDSAAMARTLRDVVPLVSPDARLFPGHGPATSLAAERRSNPFLAG
ncbi:MAG: MBL fold metallo-hydrolase, partial [Cellulomonas sp.]